MNDAVKYDFQVSIFVSKGWQYEAVVNAKQCDQMTRLFRIYWAAMCNNEHLPNIKNVLK